MNLRSVLTCFVEVCKSSLINTRFRWTAVSIFCQRCLGLTLFSNGTLCAHLPYRLVGSSFAPRLGRTYRVCIFPPYAARLSVACYLINNGMKWRVWVRNYLPAWTSYRYNKSLADSKGWFWIIAHAMSSLLVVA